MGDDHPIATPAAGGVVIRQTGGSVEVLVIHRPRHDDWSLPKGHVDPGEAAQQAALREVREETGYDCVAVVEVASSDYLTADGTRKVVRYWLMEPVSGSFEPNDEVDEIRWLATPQAMAILSYDLDRDLIRSTLGAP